MNQKENRRRLVDDLVADALELRPGDREAFLHRACAGDADLQHEVETLLEEAEHSGILDATLTFAGLTPGEIIAHRFKIVRFIASGGMGDVYEVEDLELRSRKALKTIRPDSASIPAMVARFKREIAIGHCVTHPSVCRVYDLGFHYPTLSRGVVPASQRSPMLFMTMQLLTPGDTLAKYLASHGPIPQEYALALVRQLAEGLQALHSQGYMHRDFKSSNVMLVGSEPNELRAVITDLGLARTFSGSVATWVSLQQSGRSGTPPYMAPEQLMGDPLSPKTDIYALGVVIYEMVTGHLPFTAAASRDNALRGRNTRPPAPRQYVPELDPLWETAILRCLEHDPDNRFHCVDEFIRALEGSHVAPPAKADRTPKHATGQKEDAPRPSRLRVVFSAVLVLVSVVAALFAIWRPDHSASEPKHIAVLPFRFLGSDPANQAFSDGLSETLTSNLSRLERYQKSFWVVPASAARESSTVSDAYRRLNATLVVTGTVRRTSNGVVVIADLIDSKNNHQLDSRTLSVPTLQLDTLPEHLWERVADMLDVQIDPRVIRAGAAGTTQPGAYEYYAQGRGYLQAYGVDQIDLAIEAFGKALVFDQDYALAYAGLGEAYSRKYELTKNPECIARAKWNGEEAVRLHGDLPEVRLALGNIYYHTAQPEKAIAEFEAALRDDPAMTDAYYYLGQIYEAQNRLSDAEQAYLTLISRRSGYWLGYSGLGNFYYHHGQFEKAAREFRTLIDLQPDNSIGYEDLGGTELARARYEDAIRILKRSLQLHQTPNAWTNLGSAYMYLRRYAEAVEAMQNAVALNRSDHDLWRNLGDSYRRVPKFVPRANEAYGEALKLALAQVAVDPNNPDVLSSIALYYGHLGNRQQALNFLPKALSLAPKNSDVLFTAALVYEIIGERQKAIDELDKAVVAGFPLEEIQREPELEKLRSDVRYQRWINTRQSSLSAKAAHEK